MGFVFISLYYLIRVYSFLLLVFALLSWFPNSYQTAIGRFILAAVRPILKPFQILPLQFGGLDWTVFVAIVVLNFLGDWVLRLAYAWAF